MVSRLALDGATVRERLGLGEEAVPWLEELQEIGAPVRPVELPAPKDTRALLERLRVTGDQASEALEVMPSEGSDPALWWVIERCYRVIVRDIGGYGYLRAWPRLPPDLGARGRYAYLWVFLAALPDVRRFHRERGIPDDVAWATLADLGQNMWIHERVHGEGGVGAQNWLTLHFRGAIYQLGRLQFNRSRINYDPAVIEERGAPFRHGDPALGVHIPEHGPMTPEACDASFALARDFFARHFPEHGARVATCGSWLLDEQLAEYLPADSNIIKFQRRFHLMPGGWDSDDSIVQFVFRRVNAALDELPQRTTLERAIVQHLRAGRHWLARSGWVEL